MDLRQFIFPFIMAVLTNSLMIVILYGLRKSPYFANLFGVGSMVVLYLFCVLRMYLPIEFPGFQVIVRDSVVYNAVLESLIRRNPSGPGTPGELFYVLLGVWAAGAVIFGAVYVHAQRSAVKRILSDSVDAGEDERAVLTAVAAEILGSDKNICLKRCSSAGRIMVIGFVKKYIILPVGAYPAPQLEMILRHECTHIRNKDLWLKLLIQIYCCIFWWNPISYLLKHDLDFSLEMKCDLSVIRNFEPDRVLLYLDTIHSSIAAQTNTKEKRAGSFLVCAELSDARKSKELVKRVRAITSDPPKKAARVTVSAIAALVLVAIFVFSYVFILQPFHSYEAEESDYNLIDGEEIVDGTNCYLEKQSDGSYILYYSGFPQMVIPEEEFDEGLYIGYPILEN